MSRHTEPLSSWERQLSRESKGCQRCHGIGRVTNSEGSADCVCASPERPVWRQELDHKLRAAGLPGPLRDIACKLNDLESDTMLASECGIHLAEAMTRLGLVQAFRTSDGAHVGAVDLRSDDPIRITPGGLLVLAWVDSIL